MSTQPTSSEPDTRYTLDELAALANVSARTVRYYISEGLVDRPEGEKRGAHYLPRHLQQLLQVRQWGEQGHSIERMRELLSGQPNEPAPRGARPGSVEVWSRITLADGLEVHLEPGRSGLSPEQSRALVKELLALYRRVRADGTDSSDSSV